MPQQHKTKTLCQKRAAHRTTQAKYVKKNPKAQAKRVKAATKKANKAAGKGRHPATGSRSKGAGQHGHTVGRPRKAC